MSRSNAHLMAPAPEFTEEASKRETGEMKAQTISIIGLGRTGASVGLALKASTLDVAIIGHDKDGDATQAALDAGAIDSKQWRLVRAATEGDIIIIATPDSEVEGILQAIGPDVREHTLILSLSSLKGPGQRWADRYLEQGHYVGAVAVLAAGALTDGTPGIAGARADLFRDSIFCLMPAPSADPQAVETAVNLGTVLGAKPFFVDADEYDNLVLGVETIPGLLAAALFGAVTAASGWRDMLRFANLPFAQATLPLRDDESLALRALNDQTATLHWLDQVLETLSALRGRIAEGDGDQVAAYLQQLSIERDKWLHERKKNQWEEVVQQDHKPRSIMEHFLGRRGETDG